MCLLDFMTVQAFAVLSIMNGVYHPRQLPRFDGQVLAIMMMFCDRLTPCHASMPAQERNRHLPKCNNPAIFTCYVRVRLIKIDLLM